MILFSNWQLQQGGISLKSHVLRPRARGRCEHCSVLKRERLWILEESSIFLDQTCKG